MILRCPASEYAQINALICIYTCENKVKSLCPVYEKNYDKITAMLIEQKYLDKYGIPGHVLPKVRQPKKERKTRTPKVVTKPKLAPAPVAVPADEKPKRIRRTKAEMELLRGKTHEG